MFFGHPMDRNVPPSNTRTFCRFSRFSCIKKRHWWDARFLNIGGKRCRRLGDSELLVSSQDVRRFEGVFPFYFPEKNSSATRWLYDVFGNNDWLKKWRKRHDCFLYLTPLIQKRCSKKICFGHLTEWKMVLIWKETNFISSSVYVQISEIKTTYNQSKLLPAEL